MLPSKSQNIGHVKDTLPLARFHNCIREYWAIFHHVSQATELARAHTR
jgi:hypothetical protein